jgi:hypothetical protein
MKLSKLKDHAILRAASDSVSAYISKCHPTEPDKDPKATRKESYAIETLLSLSSIVTCIDQLHLSVDMLAGYRDQSTPRKINRSDYIVFGIENYYLRLTSVYDRCLRLGNVVFQLGLPERECREATITNNVYIKGTSVAQALKGLDKFTNQFRFHRNTIAHESTYSEGELEKLGAYYYLIGEGEHQLEKFRNLYKNRADKYIANKKAEFKKHIEELERLVEAFLNAILKVFEVRLKSYV